MSYAALIVAAGRGLRAGGPTPKQWRLVAGKRVIDHTIAAFQTTPAISHICVVLHPDDTEAAQDLRAAGLIVASGGADRSGSVRNGLIALQDHAVFGVLIHDAARPCVGQRVIQDVIDALNSDNGADGAAPALAVTDALWTGKDNLVTGTRDRSGLYRAQTPQGFRFQAILDAHTNYTGTAADDVEVALSQGLTVRIIPGDETNLKVTLPGDFAKAERHLGQAMDIRTGNGFDVHRFGPGDQVTLCGVSVPYEHGLQGHSDADVGMHAITDALYGAMAEGDIGRHFPPSDPQWKGAASDIFLRHAVDLATSRGFQITHTDCTLICEHPKIGPHAAAMQARLAEIMQLDAGRISVKATTSEKLGFTGRGEGIAAMATATLVHP